MDELFERSYEEALKEFNRIVYRKFELADTICPFCGTRCYNDCQWTRPKDPYSPKGSNNEE